MKMQRARDRRLEMKFEIRLQRLLVSCVVPLLLATNQIGCENDSTTAEEKDGGQDADVDANVDTDADTDTETEAKDLPSWPNGKYITPQQVFERLDIGDPQMLLLNVSDEEFYYMGHIPGSLAIPWDDLPERLDEVDSEKHIIIYCRKGVRSESAYSTLISNDYDNVWVMDGGLEVWIALEYPTDSGDR